MKLLATDITSGRHVIFPDPTKPDDDPVNRSVIDAVRASIGYPLVFQPTALGSSRLIDGGVSNGLPVFLFEPEFKRTQIPIMAFELPDTHHARSEDDDPYSFFYYVADFLNAAINSADETERITTNGIYPIPIRISSRLTLAFDRTKIRDLIVEGHKQALPLLRGIVNLEPWAEERRARLRDQLRLLLQGLLLQLKDKTDLKDCCAYVTLLTANKKLKIQYHHRMRQNKALHVAYDSSECPSGMVWERFNKNNAAILLPFEEYQGWAASAGTVAYKPPVHHFAAIIAPLREFGGPSSVVADIQLPLIGTLSVEFPADSTGQSGQLDPMEFATKAFGDDHAGEIVASWANIVSVQLQYLSHTEGDNA